MSITRRDFVKYCTAAGAVMGLAPGDLLRLDSLLAAPNTPSVIWLQGSACTGCSVAFLNRISPAAPRNAAEILINKVSMVYHPNVMGAAGEMAVAAAEAAFESGRYILVLEGGVPTNFGGAACWAWTYGGRDVTFQEAVMGLAEGATHILGVGTCACFGGLPAAPPNPTGVKPLQQLTDRPVVHIPGCPPHPDWVAWGLVNLLLGNRIDLDTNGRPVALYNTTIHDRCPRKGQTKATTFGVDLLCLQEIGCRGPQTRTTCHSLKWNGGVNWCIDANAPCYGCTEPGFPYSPMIQGD